MRICRDVCLRAPFGKTDRKTNKTLAIPPPMCYNYVKVPLKCAVQKNIRQKEIRGVMA